MLKALTPRRIGRSIVPVILAAGLPAAATAQSNGNGDGDGAGGVSALAAREVTQAGFPVVSDHLSCSFSNSSAAV